MTAEDHLTHIDDILNPASIAIVGASDNPTRIGGRPLAVGAGWSVLGASTTRLYAGRGTLAKKPRVSRVFDTWAGQSWGSIDTMDIHFGAL